MQVRQRTMDLRGNVTGGYYFLYQSPPQQTRSAMHGKKWVTDDTIGNFWYANAFLSVFTETRPFLLSGSLYATYPPYELLKSFSSCPDALIVNPPAHHISFALSALDKSNRAWQILANTNPSSPDISVPTFIGELKDLPSLVVRVQKAGITLIERGSRMTRLARSQLTFRWALMPALRDLATLYKFQEAVDNRVKMLTNLRDRKWLSKRTGFGEDTLILPSVGTYVQSEGGPVYAMRHESHKVKSWGSARWKIVSGTKFPPTAAGMRKYAERISLGLTSFEAFSTLWELTPWSWLTDWFFGIGTSISALNNAVPCTWSELCLMRTLTSQCRYTPVTGSQSASWISVQGEKKELRISKERHVVTPTLPFVQVAVPLVRARTWQILGSLAILRSK